MATQYHLAFWNLENLFDIEGSPRRDEKVARALGNSIKGWTQALLNRKVSQLASIIKQMNGGQGPDMLGIAEVENEYVVNLLRDALAPLGRNYLYVHHDTPDRRGIDVAFIYDGDRFEVPPGDSVFSHFVMRRTATRDILQVNFKTKPKGNFLVVMGNHWPSRSGGEERSAGYRAIAGETLAYFHQRVMEIYGDSTPVIAMGDFNDEPFNVSLVEYALAIREHKKVTYARNPVFLNLMWPPMGEAIGSLFFDNAPNLLDQFLANKNLVKGSAVLKVLTGSARVLTFPEMVDKGRYPKPIPFGGMGKKVNQNGYSDHFPVEVILTEKG